MRVEEESTRREGSIPSSPFPDFRRWRHPLPLLFSYPLSNFTGDKSPVSTFFIAGSISGALEESFCLMPLPRQPPICHTYSVSLPWEGFPSYRNQLESIQWTPVP